MIHIKCKIPAAMNSARWSMSNWIRWNKPCTSNTSQKSAKPITSKLKNWNYNSYIQTWLYVSVSISIKVFLPLKPIFFVTLLLLITSPFEDSCLCQCVFVPVSGIHTTFATQHYCIRTQLHFKICKRVFVWLWLSGHMTWTDKTFRPCFLPRIHFTIRIHAPKTEFQNICLMVFNRKWTNII